MLIATCQFPVSDSVGENLEHLRRQAREAAAHGCRIVHFPEGALSGYVGVDLPSFAGYDWGALREASESVARLAAEIGVYVVFGSSHPLSAGAKPHNSVYVVSDRGELLDRSDKRFCAGAVDDEEGEHRFFTPGTRPVVFEVDGVRCGVLICHEYRYPELFREYKRLGVQLVLHSFHAANVEASRLSKMRDQVGSENLPHNTGDTLPEITMPATMIGAAAANHVWISCSNSSAPHACWPAFFVRADGVVLGRLARDQPGVLVSQLDRDAALYDSTAPWRSRAMAGRLGSGDPPLDDPRSQDRKSF